MDFFKSLHISSSGLTAQKLRMDVISGNLANINTTRTREGGPYRRKEIIFAAQPVKENTLRFKGANKFSEIKVVGVVNDGGAPILKYDPQHPDADQEGYVAMPNVKLMEEMVDMVSAIRSYEANVAAIKATKQMTLKALEIGR